MSRFIFNRSFLKKLVMFISLIASILTIIQVLSVQDKSIKDIFLSPSPIAIIIYILVLIILFCVILDLIIGKVIEEKSKIEIQLDETKQALQTALQAGQIATFKDKYYLSTEKLYIDLADEIQNKIEILTLDITNTIEEQGSECKKHSHVTLKIKGIFLDDNVHHFELLAAGDSIVKWQDISFSAYEVLSGSQDKLELQSRLADNGQDSYLKRMVVSYANKKQKGDYLELVISWVWPNMLSIIDDDYVTLPIILSPHTKKISMSLCPKMCLNFEKIGVYKYTIKPNKVEFLSDLNPTDGNIFFTDNKPQYKSCYILYYRIKK